MCLYHMCKQPWLLKFSKSDHVREFDYSQYLMCFLMFESCLVCACVYACMHVYVCKEHCLKFSPIIIITVWITGLIMWTTSHLLWRCLILAKMIQLRWESQQHQLIVMGALMQGGRLQTEHLKCAGTFCLLYCLRTRPSLNGCGDHILPIWSSTEDYMKEERNQKNFSVYQCFASKIKYVCACT